MAAVVRFAPSPTGLMHIGNARTAILNWLFALKMNGRFVLRFDDTDQARSTTAFADAIAEDLAWLGIVPDDSARQSQRIALYDAAAEQLKARDRLYACYETPDELERKRKRQLARGRPPVYDREGLRLDSAARARLEGEGRCAHWRFKLPAKTIEWHDLVRGDQSVNLASLSDPVLVRADGSYLYTLPSVVDDIDMAVSHVIRGEDHTVNSAVQIALMEALGAPCPVFAHHSLLVGADGKGLSKRFGSLSVRALRGQGLEAMAVVSHAALIGTSRAIAPHSGYETLTATFDLGALSRAPARFDEVELAGLNARLLHAMPYSAIAGRLDCDEPFWLAVRANLAKLADARDWLDVAYGDVEPVIAPEDRAFLDQARALLPSTPWDETTWKTWTRELKRATGRKGKALFMPLRLALTGRDRGPELAAFLPLIGRARAAKRLA